MTNQVRTLLRIPIVALIIVSLGCGGCGGVKDVGKDISHPTSSVNVKSTNDTISSVKDDIVNNDTTTQIWKNQHYYYGTFILLPDSIKAKVGFALKDGRLRIILPTYKYEPITYSDPHDPSTTDMQVFFMDSITKLPTKIISKFDNNPYKDLSYKMVSDERTVKVDGVMTYDIRNVDKSDLKDLLLTMDVNTDTVPTKLSKIEIMSVGNSQMELTAVSMTYALQVVDVNGKIIANQTTYKVYNRYGELLGQIVENGHGLYQHNVTRDGLHLAAAFGGRYGCQSGQYLKPYFKIFETKTGRVIHHEDLDFSDGLHPRFNYFYLIRGGAPGDGFYTSIYDLDKKKIYTAEKLFTATKYWGANYIIQGDKTVKFTDPFFTQLPFSPKN